MKPPVYHDTDRTPAGACYVQEKVDGWGVRITVAGGLHTVTVARSGRLLWTERAGGPEGTYLGEWVHGTQRSLTDPRRGLVVLYDGPGPEDGYLRRMVAVASLCSACPQYLMIHTWGVSDSPTWDEVVARGWEGLIYRDDDARRVWRRKVQVELDAPVLAVEETRILVKLPCGAAAWVSSGLSSTLRPEVGQVVRITGMEITRDGKVRHPVVAGVKETGR